MHARVFPAAAAAPRSRRPGLAARITAFLTLSRSRARLAELDPHLLRDIGISREQAEAESRRAPWDAPQHWLR